MIEMARHFTTVWQACAAFALVATTAGAAFGDSIATWEQSARWVLTAELQRSRPDVREWELRPLTSKRQQQQLADAAPLEVRVTHVGARSAVSVRMPDQRAVTTVWFVVRGMKNVLVATRDTGPGRAVSPADASVEARDVMALGCEPLVAAAQLEAMRARSPLRVSATICREHIEERPTVARGERVTVHSNMGRVRVTGSAIAEQDGAVGDVLKVRHPQSRAQYLAQVTGPQEVRVNE